MAPLVDHAHDEKQRAGGKAVVQHVVERAFHALKIEDKETQHHKTEMAHRGIGHQFLQIRLHHRHQGAVNDADHGQGANHGSGRERGFGKQRDGEAEKTIGPHLKKDTGQNDRASRGRLHVGIGKPGMEGEEGDFNREGKGEGQKQPHLLVIGEMEMIDLKQIEG